MKIFKNKRYMRKLRLIIFLIGVLSFMPLGAHLMNNATAKTATGLSASRQRNADIIARVCINNWHQYGCLPSIAIAQAMQETGLGSAYNNGNLWGIKSGRVSYPSVEAGTYAYMRVINNGYYKGAPFCTDYKTQIRRILDGGYCQPEGAYYSAVLSIVQRYHLTRYDDQLFAKLKKEKEEKQKELRRKKEAARKARIKKEKIKKEKAHLKKYQELDYMIAYDGSLPDHTIAISDKIMKKGTVQLVESRGMLSIYDIKPIKTSYGENVICCNDPYLVGKMVKLRINLHAKG